MDKEDIFEQRDLPNHCHSDANIERNNCMQIEHEIQDQIMAVLKKGGCGGVSGAGGFTMFEEVKNPKPPKLEPHEIQTFVEKLLSNLVEDTVEEIEKVSAHHETIQNLELPLATSSRSQSSIDLDRRLNMLLKILYNVPLISCIEDPGRPASASKSTPEIRPSITIQMTVLHQRISNLCGYHMSHNLINFLNYLKSIDRTEFLTNISSSASFWKYRRDLGRFLDQLAKRRGEDRTKYPWRQKDCLEGDYERRFDEVFSKSHPLFKSTFSSSPIMQVEKFTLELQFGRFITSFDSLIKMQEKVDAFLQEPTRTRRSLSRPIKAFAFQIACTCHWVCMVVVFIKDQLFFFYFDSHNVSSLGLKTEAKIQELISKVNSERAQIGKKPWEGFNLQCQTESLKDINIAEDLIKGMFARQESVVEYLLEHNFKKQFLNLWEPHVLRPLDSLIKSLDKEYLNEVLRPKNNQTIKFYEDGIYIHLREKMGDLKSFLSTLYELMLHPFHLLPRSKLFLSQIITKYIDHEVCSKAEKQATKKKKSGLSFSNFFSSGKTKNEPDYSLSLSRILAYLATLSYNRKVDICQQYCQCISDCYLDRFMN